MKGVSQYLLHWVTPIVLLCPVACRNMLDVAPPAGVETNDALQNRSGAEGVLANAKAGFFGTYAGQTSGLVITSGLLADEFVCSDAIFSCGSNNDDFVDARSGSVTSSGAAQAFSQLLTYRSVLLIAERGLSRYEPVSEQRKAGEAFALAGYTELLLAEQFCAGVTLDPVLPDGGWAYGMPLTTDSLLGVAETHFDSALVYAHDDVVVTALARVGLGRTRLDRGQYTDAANAVADVATDFVYNAVTDPSGSVGTVNLYTGVVVINGAASFNVANQEGRNGLDYVSAHDPRLVLDSTLVLTQGGANFYYPVKFGNPSSQIPLATGVEARLIEAEAALRAHQPDTWLADLNALRTTCVDAAACPTPAPAGTGGVAGLFPLTDPGTDSARIALMFRERAFWLFGTATRLGDMRRLLKQYTSYGFTAASVYPVGTYIGGGVSAPTTYGTDISLALPKPDENFPVSNPNYKGCTGSATVP